MKLFLLFTIGSLAIVSQVHAECTLEDDGADQGISCEALADADLPLSNYSGYYAFIEVTASPDLTTLPASSFGSAYSDVYIISDCDNLATLEADFLGTTVSAVQMVRLQNLPKLIDFDWSFVNEWYNLAVFELSGTAISSIPSNIAWPGSLQNITMDDNSALQEIAADAFYEAHGLVSISLLNLNGAVALRQNAFHIVIPDGPSLDLSLAGDTAAAVIEDNVFGNVDGGELWGRLAISLPDFPEGAFRLLLKTHFDLNFESLLFTTNGVIDVRDCSCTIAWLYKDAEIYGHDKYLNIVGSNNVICPISGPVLESDDDNFNQQMHNCPATEMPWPDGICDGSGGSHEDTTVDPNNCHCFYHCNGDQVQGHECCAEGLGYDPTLPGCNWLTSIPNCD